ncbi:MAG: hypothetical protein KF754_16090 [Planctomycetes bacterium]|nr:hypothetical protein [Planctomycetota bacterium]
MERTVKATMGFRARVLAARVLQSIGWAGLVGVGLLLAGLAWLALAYRMHRLPLPVVDAPAVASETTPTPRLSAAPDITLPERSELPLLLTQIQQTVVGHGLGWAAADYKVTAATESAPTMLEVRCRLNGAYPKLRAAIAQLLSGVPGLSIRDFAMSRPNVDVAEVEAKLTLVVFLRDDGPSALSDARGSTP